MRTGAIAAALLMLAAAAPTRAQEPVPTRRAAAAAPAAEAPAEPAAEAEEGEAAEAAAPAAAPQPEVMEPVNAIERTFVAALTNPELRPAFRRQLLEAPLALALVEGEDGALAPRTVPIQGGRRAVAIFTSAERLQSVLGEAAGFEVMSGREALERAGDQNVVLNFMWSPMLTLEPEDVASYLEAPETPSRTDAAEADAAGESEADADAED